MDYRDAGAVAAGLWFRGWDAAAPEAEAVACLLDVAPYEPGAFYRRELPGLLAALARGPTPDVVVIDGYAWLDAGRPGLGAHLAAALSLPVVGVAKTRYASATGALPVLRGASLSPLYVSAAEFDVVEAAAGVSRMAGPYRVPALLQQVDRLARTAAWAGAS